MKNMATGVCFPKRGETQPVGERRELKRKILRTENKFTPLLQRARWHLATRLNVCFLQPGLLACMQCARNCRSDSWFLSTFQSPQKCRPILLDFLNVVPLLFRLLLSSDIRRQRLLAYPLINKVGFSAAQSSFLSSEVAQRSSAAELVKIVWTPLSTTFVPNRQSLANLSKCCKTKKAIFQSVDWIKNRTALRRRQLNFLECS